jgi:hypothetical protein
MSEAHDVAGAGSFATSRGEPDLFDPATGKPALASSQNKFAPPPATVEAEADVDPPSLAPAATSSEGTGLPGVDPEMLLKVEEARLTSLQQTQLPPLPPAPTSPGAKPDRFSFSSPESADAAIENWARQDAIFQARKADYDALAQQSEQHVTAVAQSKNAVFQARRSAFVKSHPDYAAVVEQDPTLFLANKPGSPAVVHAIAMSENGPEIAYWLAKNKLEEARLTGMSDPAQILMEVARLGAGLKKSAPATFVAPRPQAQSQRSGKPIDQLPMDDYAKARLEKMAAERRPSSMFGGR